MRKLFICLMAIAFLLGCTKYDDQVVDLVKRVAALEKKAPSAMDLAQYAGASFRPYRAISGGAAGALDSLASPTIGDVAFVVLNEDAAYGNAVFIYVYTDYGAAVSEALPYEVKPDTGDSANYAWSLAFSSVAVPVAMTGSMALTLGQQRMGIVHATGAGTLTLLPAATIGYGSMICIYVQDVSEVVIVESSSGTDIFNLQSMGGAILHAGDVIDSPGAAGDFLCLVASTDVDKSGTDGYITMGYGKTAWVDGGAS
jgi:hypothetical protein